MESGPWTVLKLLNWTKDFLDKAGVESPRLCAEILLAHALGCKRIELYTRFDYQPTAPQLAAYRAMVQRARNNEPVAYLVGEKEFYSLKFTITPGVLIPRAETEILVTEALAHLKSLGRPSRVWDCCTGSGCVGIAIAHQAKDAQVLATDISADALTVAQQNAQSLGVADRLRVRQADLLTIPDDCQDLAPFDVITANPPYIAVGQEVAPTVKHEPAQALYAGNDGLDCIRPIIAQAAALLAENGILAMEFGYGQADAVRDLIVASGNYAEPRILTDHQGIERSAVARKRA